MLINETMYSSAGVVQQRKLNVGPVVAAITLVASAVVLLVQQAIEPNINIGDAADVVLPAVLANLPRYEFGPNIIRFTAPTLPSASEQ